MKDIVAAFLGVMFGVSQANKVIAEISRRLAVQVSKRLPQQALTKYAWYGVLKQLLKWMGIKLTKDTFAKAISKAIPIVGGFFSGGITYFSMKKMSKRLQYQLRIGDLANINTIKQYMDIDPDDIIDINFDAGV